MASSDRAETISLIAAEALTIYRFAQINASGQAIEANDATSLAGVIMETVALGVVVPIMTEYGAIIPITLGATLAAGARVMSNASGQAIAEATAGSVGAGMLLEGGVSGNIVNMLFQPQRRFAA